MLNYPKTKPSYTDMHVRHTLIVELPKNRSIKILTCVSDMELHGDMHVSILMDLFLGNSTISVERWPAALKTTGGEPKNFQVT